MVSRVRRLCAAGFDRDDLTDALAAELVRHREELAFLYGEGPSRLERLLRRLAYAGVCLAATAVGGGLRAPGLDASSRQLPAPGLGAGGALLAAVIGPARAQPRTHPQHE